MIEQFAQFSALVRSYISESLRVSTWSDSAFSDLALSLFRLQYEHNPGYGRFCERRERTPRAIARWQEIPAIPSSAFKELELTVLPAAERIAVFQSSGTTLRDRSRHFHSAQSLALYEASILPWFERNLLSDLADLVDEQIIGPLDKLPMLFLTPAPGAAPSSSLVHMFEVARREFGARDSLFAGCLRDKQWSIDLDAALFAIRKSMCANRPLALLGTAFNFVHLLDHFAKNNMRYRLARGSRILETGGYKGQSREVPKRELHALITKHLGIPSSSIVTEYGMCELSSQAYDCPVSSEASPRAFHFPPWARSMVVSAETGFEVADGEIGLIRVFDLANVFSVVAVQTEDLGVRRGDGFELLGRASQAQARGCSLFSVAS